jgi:dTDP-4-amino-4,6-dideoxygalactose transaminase
VLLLDNAHGFGTEQGGARCPREAPVQAYSFHATKTLPAVEGGAVVASDPRLLAEVRRLRNHGVASDPMASAPGFNAKMSELHAAVGLRSLHGLEAALARRREYAERLRRTMAAECAEAFTVQAIPRGMRSNFQNLGVLCRRGGRPNVPSIQTALDRAGIDTRRYFWPPLHQLPAYRGRCSLPVTDAVSEAILCLPLHSRMDPPVLDRMEDALRQAARAR